MGKNSLMINQENGLLKIFKDGDEFIQGFKLEDKIVAIKKEIGKPENIIGNEECGYYEYQNGLRIGYIDDFINEFALLFCEEKNNKFQIEILEIDCVKQLSKKTSIHDFIKILNFSKVEWKTCDEKSTEMFSIITEGNVLILFNLDNGKLYKILYSQISKGIGRIIFKDVSKD